jgi:predicted lipoprotein with Yx(FWY)xxD motif
VVLRRRLALLGLAALAACRAAPDAARAPTVLAVADSPDIGRYVTDASGRAVYTRSGPPTEQVSCDAACRDVWTPVPGAEHSPESPEPAIQTELVGAIRGDDGWQATYGRHPLFFRADAATDTPPPRRIADQWGVWVLLFPHGVPMPPDP